MQIHSGVLGCEIPQNPTQRRGHRKATPTCLYGGRDGTEAPRVRECPGGRDRRAQSEVLEVPGLELGGQERNSGPRKFFMSVADL